MVLGGITDKVSSAAEKVGDTVSDATESASDAAEEVVESGSDAATGGGSDDDPSSGSTDSEEATADSSTDTSESEAEQTKSPIDQAAEAVAEPVQRLGERAEKARSATDDIQSGAAEATRRFASSAGRAAVASAPAARSAANALGGTASQVSEAAGEAADIADDPARSSAETAATPLTREAGSTQTEQPMQTVEIDGVEYRVTDDGGLERASMTTSSIPRELSDIETGDSDLQTGQQFAGQESRTDIGREQLPKSANINQEGDEPIIDNLRSAADDNLEALTSGWVGVSDDFTSTDDATYGISDDPTSMEDSGGVKNVLEEAATPIQRAGKNFQEKRAEEGEQFGDYDWEISGVDLEEGARSFQEDAREFGGNVGETVAYSPAAQGLDLIGQDRAADRLDQISTSATRGAGQGAGDLVGGAPVIGMETAEAVGYSAQNPKEAASKVPGAVSASAVGTAQQFRSDPAQATGSLASQSLIGAGLARGATVATRSARAGSRTSSRTGSGSGARSPRTLADDNRGQLDLTFRDRGDSDSSGSSSTGSRDGGSDLPEEMQDLLDQFENAQSRRDARQRAEQNILEKRLEEGRRQERGDEPRSVSRREFQSVSRPDFETVSRGPDTSRSGPTDAQAGSRSSLDTDLSPRESQLAARLGRETPTSDLRGVDATRRSTPTTDLRVDAAASSRSGAGTGAAAGGSLDLLDQAQEPQVTGDDGEPAGTEEDTALESSGSAGAGPLALLEDVQSGASGLLGEIGPAETPATGTETGTGTSSTATVGPTTGTIPGTDTGTDTGVDTGVDTGTRVGGDTGQEPATGPIADNDSTGTVRDRNPPRDPDNPRGPNDPTTPRDPDNSRFPTDPERPRDPDRTRRIELPDIDIGSDSDGDDEEMFGAVATSYSFDFIDPLTGEEIETEETGMNSAI